MKKIILAATFAILCVSTNAQWLTSGSNIYNSNTGNVGIGTTAPGSPLSIVSGYGKYDFGSVGANFFQAKVENTATSGNGYSAFRSVTNSTIEGILTTYLSTDPNLQFGLARGGWSGVFHTGGNGLMIGTMESKPMVFGSNNIERISNAQGFQNYERALAGGGYPNTQDGGAFQMYFPYNPTYRGIAPQVRFGRWDNQGWSTWSTFFTSANANLSTIDWNTKNLTVYGNVLIGKTSQANTSYKLDVDGIIRSQKVAVNTNGADFVFDPSYKLSELDFLNTFIKKYGHLPDVPSAEEMKIWDWI